MIDVCLIMEFAYLNGAVKDDHEDRPVNPLLFIVADEDQEMILSMNMLSPKDKEEEIVLGFFVNYVLEYDVRI